MTTEAFPPTIATLAAKDNENVKSIQSILQLPPDLNQACTWFFQTFALKWSVTVRPRWIHTRRCGMTKDYRECEGAGEEMEGVPLPWTASSLTQEELVSSMFWECNYLCTQRRERYASQCKKIKMNSLTITIQFCSIHHWFKLLIRGDTNKRCQSKAASNNVREKLSTWEETFTRL